MGKSDDSREKILRAAIQIFAEKGLAGASVRAITSAAGVNHALIGYYFGSKVALYEEVLERASELISRPKFEKLAELRAQYGEAPIPVRALLDAYIRSFFDDYGNPQSIAKTWLRFYGRFFSEQNDEVYQATTRAGGPVRNAFVEEFELALPELSRRQIVYRLGSMIGAISFWRGEIDFLDAHFEEQGHGHIDVDELIEEMISTSCAIFTMRPGNKKLASSRTKPGKASLQQSNIAQHNDLTKPKALRSRRHRKRVSKAS